MSHLIPLRTLLLLSLGACVPTVTVEDSGETADTDTDSAAPEACEGSAPIPLADGSASGFETCADGAIHRASGDSTFDPTSTDATCEGTEESLGCVDDSDCTAGAYGRCVTGIVEGGFVEGSYCGCEYSCATDADCDSRSICVPPDVVTNGETHPTCEYAGCVTDADCDSGECGVSSYNNGCGWVVSVMCRDEDVDLCHGIADCAEDSTCAINYDGDAWECMTDDCDIGRPLLVLGVARVAPVVARVDWAEVLAGLPADPVLAERWRQIAAMEHASVASFARATLQLLANGAPPDLLADTQAAAADEVRHARIAFGIASAFAGRVEGPGPLPLADALSGLSARDAIDGLIDEACVGETLGAAEARAAAEACTVPALAAALREIADDEARHAALAWRTLRWILSTVDEAERERAFARLESAPLPVPSRPVPSGWGILSGNEQARVHRAALREVVRPCIAALRANTLGPCATWPSSTTASLPPSDRHFSA